MRPRTVVELARGNGIPLPTADPTELYRYTSLDTFLQVFWLVQSTLGGRADWARLAYESVVDGAAHGLVYRETFFTPARHRSRHRRGPGLDREGRGPDPVRGGVRAGRPGRPAPDIAPG